MAWFICLGALAAFGFFCAIWALFGFLLPGSRDGTLVFPCTSDGGGEAMIRRYVWLRGLGFVRSPLLIVCGTPSLQLQQLVLRHRNVEICTPAQLPQRLELERYNFE